MHGVTGNVYCGLHDFAEMSFMLHLLRAGDLFADIGANVGSYTVLALIAFAWFWPIWTDVLLTKSEWDARIWFQRWI